MELYYECSDGTRIDLISNGIYAQNPETLIDNEWKYAVLQSNGISKIKRFYKEAEERILQLSIMYDSEEEYNEMMYQMHRCFEKDVRTKKPGKIWWNGFYKEVFMFASFYQEYEEMFYSIEKTVHVLSVNPYWTRKSLYQYPATTNVIGALDYNFDYNMDFDKANYIATLDNKSIEYANFELIFYGPCENPKVTIAGHNYEVMCTLQKGEYAMIDTIHQKIYKYDSVGNMENIFHLRNKEDYVFQKIPAGEVQIFKEPNISLSITVYDERGEPSWI